MVAKTLFLSLLFAGILSSYSSLIPQSFIRCLSHESTSNVSVLSVLYAPTNSSYQSIFDSRTENLRFSNSTSPKPLAIITPRSYSHVQTTIVCSKQNGIQIRTRSGGHDFEGTSYRSDVPFVLLDLRDLDDINVSIEDNTAWVESGATIGELYYAIAEKSLIHGFPAGLYPTIGVGGHFSGGGVGNLIRKYGLAADNVIDALIVNSEGRILDRKSMGTDLFWAIRGGGGASFGVIIAWRIKVVHVPPLVTVFELSRTLEQGAINLIHKWQDIGSKLDEDLLISVVVSAGQGTQTIATFRSLFLGRAEDLLRMVRESFPEISLSKEDCVEMSWIESVVRFSGYRIGETKDALKNGIAPFPASYFKGKSDLVYKHIPIETLEEFWKWCSDASKAPPRIHIELHPYGGRMNEISKSETPFPHRKGVLFEILYIVAWDQKDKNGGQSSDKHINWLRGLYGFMTPFVSKSPRGAIVNVKDFDLGVNDGFATTTYSEAKKWGSRYFKNNFKRLALVKGEVDPDNFFYYEQTIPLPTSLS